LWQCTCSHDPFPKSCVTELQLLLVTQCFEHVM
jgi:hypothetical protein